MLQQQHVSSVPSSAAAQPTFCKKSLYTPSTCFSTCSQDSNRVAQNVVSFILHYRTRSMRRQQSWFVHPGSHASAKCMEASYRSSLLVCEVGKRGQRACIAAFCHTVCGDAHLQCNRVTEASFDPSTVSATYRTARTRYACVSTPFKLKAVLGPCWGSLQKCNFLNDDTARPLPWQQLPCTISL